MFSNVAGGRSTFPSTRPSSRGWPSATCRSGCIPRGRPVADYAGEARSKYDLWWAFGWPYDTSVAMGRLVFSGLFDRHPELVVITHHIGAMIPFCAGRVGGRTRSARESERRSGRWGRARPPAGRPIDYFRMFYGDTALFGAWHAMEPASPSSAPITFCSAPICHSTRSTDRDSFATPSPPWIACARVTPRRPSLRGQRAPLAAPSLAYLMRERSAAPLLPLPSRERAGVRVNWDCAHPPHPDPLPSGEREWRSGRRT